MKTFKQPHLNRAAWDSLPHTQELDVATSEGVPLRVKLVKMAIPHERNDWDVCFEVSTAINFPADLGRGRNTRTLGAFWISEKDGIVEHNISIEVPDGYSNPMATDAPVFIRDLMQQLYEKTKVKLKAV